MTPINLEAKKDGLQQRQDGTWTLKLTVNGEDMQNAVDLLKAPMGQRYMVVMVALEEEDEEAAHRALEKATKRHWNDLSRAEQAGILCAEREFREWFRREGNLFKVEDEDSCANAVRNYCGVVSRKHIDWSSDAKERWDQLVSQFRQETGRETEIR